MMEKDGTKKEAKCKQIILCEEKDSSPHTTWAAIFRGQKILFESPKPKGKMMDKFSNYNRTFGSQEDPEFLAKFRAARDNTKFKPHKRGWRKIWHRIKWSLFLRPLHFMLGRY